MGNFFNNCCFKLDNISKSPPKSQELMILPSDTVSSNGVSKIEEFDFITIELSDSFEIINPKSTIGSEVSPDIK